ncbi:MAG: hypothetical protein HOH14_04905 [Gammaproteobacteria bacterium]|jgi:hypothetical protein|nr:hypothetical protein [Gammaproteobacteria bacterium]
MKTSIIRTILSTLVLLTSMASTSTLFAQPGGQQQSAQEQSAFDISGNWVALVTEDWRFRMVVAEPGDYEGIGLTAHGREVADAWDPEADIASGNTCKAYGAGGLMRIPTRLNISWSDGNVLRIDTDAGMQTRLLKFGDAQDNVGAGSLQGVTHASWDLERAGAFGGPVVGGSIAAVTTQMAPGYLRRNGVPYGTNAVLTEHYELLVGGDGTEYLAVFSVLEDPEHLTQLYTTSTNFKREPDGSKWNPAECMAK